MEQFLSHSHIGKEFTVFHKKLSLDDSINAHILIRDRITHTVDILAQSLLDQFAQENFWGESNVYTTFSHILDAQNRVLKQLENDGNSLKNLNVVVAIEEGSTVHFSKIGGGSVYLISDQVTEISYHEQKELKFGYVSSWDLAPESVLVLSNIRLFHYLTKSDFAQTKKHQPASEIADTLNKLVMQEDIDGSFDIAVLYSSEKQEDEKNDSQIFEKFNNFTHDMKEKMAGATWYKKLGAKMQKWKQEIPQHSLLLKNIVFFSWIVVSFVLLVIILTPTIQNSRIENTKAQFKEKLDRAYVHQVIASENIGQPEIFNENIIIAEGLLAEVIAENLFMQDTEKLQTDLNLLKNQFNGVENFSPSHTPIYSGEVEDTVSIVMLDKKMFLVKPDRIIGPIINGENTGETLFKSESEIVEAKVNRNSVMLLTNDSQIYSFNGRDTITPVNTQDENGWEQGNTFTMYAGNIYLVAEEKNQIFKYTPIADGFSAAEAFLQEDEVTKYREHPISNIDIDGGVYILREDLILERLLTFPTYEKKGISLNELPNNYEKRSDHPVQIVARNNLNYIYFFFDNKIWIFEPNSRRYQDVTALRYLGQIESEKSEISQIYVNYDNDLKGEILIALDDGVYKLNFEVSDTGIILR